MNSKAIIMHPSDNVATALTELAAGDKIVASLEERTEETVLLEDIQFAHKYALRDIAQGEEIRKYGMPIGKALEDIPAGRWVHVHNCRSQHWGDRNQEYGIRA